ncbi:hypothetical protein RRG08_052851 [Elysia crispata]|uniref:Fibronectin type-III domain-containing protein n=1 Tax=Elysia crispata TaxID=231223 RepID=A0AAE1ED11_9GAST|nr:hypothetical protein RRG08_052851 [Elysia crispata]
MNILTKTFALYMLRFFSVMMKPALSTSLILALLALAAKCTAAVSCEKSEPWQKAILCLQPYMGKIRDQTDADVWCKATTEMFACIEAVPCDLPQKVLDDIDEKLREFSPNCHLLGGGPAVSEDSENKADISNTQVVDLTAEYLGDSRVLLTWNVTDLAGSLDGFKVAYREFFKYTESPYEVDEIPATLDDDGQYSTVLNLDKKTRYEINVTPFNSQHEANASDPVFIYVSGKKMRLAAWLSVTASPLGSEDTLISYTVLGDKDLTSVNFFYLKENEAVWTQLTKDTIALRGENFVVLSGLEEGTTYYIFSKAWVGRSYHTTMTSVRTAWSSIEDHETVGDLPLVKTPKPEGGEFVDWSTWNSTGVYGYKVTVTFRENNAAQRSKEVHYLPSGQARFDLDASGETVDSVKVQPFDVFGLKTGGELQ